MLDRPLRLTTRAACVRCVGAPWSRAVRELLTSIGEAPLSSAEVALILLGETSFGPLLGAPVVDAQKETQCEEFLGIPYAINQCQDSVAPDSSNVKATQTKATACARYGYPGLKPNEIRYISSQLLLYPI